MGKEELWTSRIRVEHFTNLANDENIGVSFFAKLNIESTRRIRACTEPFEINDFDCRKKEQPTRLKPQTRLFQGAPTNA